MNIIEAISEAKKGALIADTFMKKMNCFLKYIDRGVLYQYEIVDGKSRYKYEVHNFTMEDILSDWDIIENKYFYCSCDSQELIWNADKRCEQCGLVYKHDQWQKSNEKNK